MFFQWYAVDERGFVAEVESFDSPLPEGDSFDLYETVVLEYAVHLRPDLQRRLYRYREVSASEDRFHVRSESPDEPLTLEELSETWAVASIAVRYVEVDFDLSDAFIPEEIVGDSRKACRDSVIVSIEPTVQAGTG